MRMLIQGHRIGAHLRKEAEGSIRFRRRASLRLCLNHNLDKLALHILPPQILVQFLYSDRWQNEAFLRYIPIPWLSDCGILYLRICIMIFKGAGFEGKLSPSWRRKSERDASDRQFPRPERLRQEVDWAKGIPSSPKRKQHSSPKDGWTEIFV